MPSLSLEKISESKKEVDDRIRKSNLNLAKTRSRMLVKRQSSGVNYFLGQMKFKELEGAKTKEPSPLKNTQNLESEDSDESDSDSSDTSSDDLGST